MRALHRVRVWWSPRSKAKRGGFPKRNTRSTRFTAAKFRSKEIPFEWHMLRVSEPLLALGILSSPTEVDRRAYIRDTLRREVAANEVVFRFLLGSKPAATRVTEADVLHLQVGADSKKILTLKSLLWFLKARSVCPNARFYGKTDSDTFIVWHRLLPSLWWIATNTTWAHMPLLVGMTSWTSYLPEAPSFCGCCGGSEHHARILQRKQNAAWGPCFAAKGGSDGWSLQPPRWSRERNSTVEGPFPFAWGALYFLSREAVFAIDSRETRAFLDWLRRTRLSRRMAYTEDLVMSRLALASSPNATVIRFAKDLIANIDDGTGMETIHFRRSPRCLSHLGLPSAASLMTGHRTLPWNLTEAASPRQVAVHHVATREQWWRIERLTDSWKKIKHPCLLAPPSIVYRQGEAVEKERYKIFPLWPRHRLEMQHFIV